MSVVIDASYAVDLTTAPARPGLYREALIAAEGGLIAPPLFWFEAASGLRGLFMRGLLNQAQRDGAIVRLRGLDIVIEAPLSNIERVIALSDRHQLTVYDAAYLELALRTASALATRDKALIQVADRMGVLLLA